MKLDILAIGAHPDDVELSCSGTLLVHNKLGYKTGIVDLTKGELGSRGSAALRKEEADAASKILNVDVRENLGFKDGFFENDEQNKKRLIQAIRKYRPNIVLSTATHDRHPDHGRGSVIIKDACFLSGLIKIETFEDGVKQEAWRPKKIFNYIQDQYIEPDLIIDISEFMDLKMESILAYKSQFHSDDSEEPVTYISSESFLSTIKARNIMMGKKIGVRFGEGFLSVNNHIGLKDFSGMIFPDLV
jgi:bacillithiol biosynthesis deacetylase BshB1